MGFGAMAKMAAKAAATQAKAAAKNVAKDLAQQAKAEFRGAAMAAKNQAIAAGRARANQMTKNAISFGTAKLNQTQARAAQRIGAAPIGTQAGLPVMAGPRGGNFRLNNRGQRLPVLPVG